jgi:GntR family transcriptional regulator, transcriptional repressor for pyruvate dehydrogenase complex
MIELQNQPSQIQIDQLLNAAFRLSGTLLSTRDKMVKDLGLTSALWQVLNEVVGEERGLSAAQIARRIGLTRQAVQRTANDLVAAGMTAFADNPADRRTQQILITDKGKAALETANARQFEWVRSFGNALEGGTLGNAAEFLNTATVIVGALPEAQSVLFQEVTSQPIAAADPPPQGTQSKKSRIFEGVNSHILEQVKVGLLVPGSKLPSERDLSAKLGVGRPAVREALRSLEISGVLRFQRGARGGAFVKESGSDGIETSIRSMLILGRLPLSDLLDVRASLLGQCARLGAERGTKQDFARLDSNIDELERCINTFNNQFPAIEPAVEFYRLAARSSHNPLMILLVNAIAGLVAEMLTKLEHRPRRDSVSARREMLAAMREGRADDAARVIRLHSHDTNRLLLKSKQSFVHSA